MRTLIVLALVACSTPPKAPPPSNHDTTGAASRDDRAKARLHELADALAHDRPIGGLVDPKDGAWLWSQPGAMVSPSVHVAPGDPRKPSEMMPGPWAADAAKSIEHGLGVLDTDADPSKPDYYVDCGADTMPPAKRANLITHGIELVKEQPALLDSPDAKGTATLGFHFVYSDTAVYLSEQGDQLYVAHVLGWTPCAA
ncbi:MAG TPA: hypothetical protein VL463_07595 [Kofleriaceae bacterium]|nr:hypothetical protein [Kofleriaceae bacterium]